MRKLFLFPILFLCSTITFGQGFSSFTAEDTLQPAVIKHTKGDAPSSVEVIVSEKADIKNIKFRYKLLSGCSLSPQLNNDFTQPQKVLVTKTDGTSKEWVVTVKKLQKATLPFELNFSDQNPSAWNSSIAGWAGIGIDTTKPSVIRFGNEGASFWAAFDKPAKSVTYKLIPVSKTKVDFDGIFLVETSEDAQKWIKLTEYNSKNQFEESNTYSFNLPENARFVRWTYTERNKLNINLNNISIKN